MSEELKRFVNALENEEIFNFDVDEFDSRLRLQNLDQPGERIRISQSAPIQSTTRAIGGAGKRV